MSFRKFWILTGAVTLLFFGCRPDHFRDQTIPVGKVFEITNDSILVNKYVILDIRSRMDYIRGHLVSAFWVSKDSLENKMRVIQNELRPVIVYDYADIRPESRVYKLLSGTGKENLFIMNGGFDAWTKSAFPVAIQLVRNTSDVVDVSKTYIMSDEAFRKSQGAGPKPVFIDIRPFPAFKESHIKGALCVPYVPINEFVVGIEEFNFDRSQLIILYGDDKSDPGEKAVEVMLRNDFVNVHLMQGGITEWISRGYPVE